MSTLQYLSTLVDVTTPNRHQPEHINRIVLKFAGYKSLGGLFGDYQKGLVGREYACEYPSYDEHHHHYKYKAVLVYAFQYNPDCDADISYIKGLPDGTLAAWFALDGIEYGWTATGKFCSSSVWIPLRANMHIAIYMDRVPDIAPELHIATRTTEHEIGMVPVPFCNVPHNTIDIDEFEMAMCMPPSVDKVYAEGHLPDEVADRLEKLKLENSVKKLSTDSIENGSN